MAFVDSTANPTWVGDASYFQPYCCSTAMNTTLPLDARGEPILDDPGEPHWKCMAELGCQGTYTELVHPKAADGYRGLHAPDKVK